MVKYLKLTYLLITCILCSCINDTSRKITTSKKVKIIDSLVINFPNAILVDATENNLLFFNRASNDIAVTNINGTSINVSNNFGQDDKSHGKLYSSNVRFLSDTTFGVSLSDKILEYDLNGNYSGVSKIDNNTISPINSFKKINDSLIYFVSIPEGRTNTLDYYKYPQEILVKSDILNKLQNKFVRFPQNDLFTEDFFHPYIYDHFFNIKNKSELTYINSNGNRAYVYDLTSQDLSLKRSFELRLDDYKRLEIEYNAFVDMEESIAQAFCSPIIRGSFMANENQFIVYTNGFS